MQLYIYSEITTKNYYNQTIASKIIVGRLGGILSLASQCRTVALCHCNITSRYPSYLWPASKRTLFIGICEHRKWYIHPFNGPFSGTTQVSRYQKGKTDLDFTEARDSEWQWHQLGHTQVCTLLQTDNHASTPPLSFLQAGCPSCRPTNSVKALKAHHRRW